MSWKDAPLGGAEVSRDLGNPTAGSTESSQGDQKKNGKKKSRKVDIQVVLNYTR